LNLLIYSRDKADPGPAETICKGDTIEIQTFGGTKWTWSPAYNMRDSSLRKTAIWPDTSFTYEIIIADSSGCGAPDTAYKIIQVRNPPRVKINELDTAYCLGANFSLSADFENGDSSAYNWTWW